MTEDELQQHVVHLMRAFGRPDVAWCAVANGEARSASTGAKLKRQGVIAGAPDLVFCIDGKYHGVELKIATGRLSNAQKDFASWIWSAKGEYHVCYGLEQSFMTLQKIGALLPSIRLTYPTSPALMRERAIKSIHASRK